MTNHPRDTGDKPPGMAESAARFEGASEDRWAIARARLEEHERTGAPTMSIEEVGTFLRREIARLRAESKRPKKA